jgi:hypothetical protein
MRCTVGLGKAPASAFAVRISSAAARAAWSCPAASACSAVCSNACTCERACGRHLLRRLHLREPALLDHDQRRLEALRERRRAHRAVERAPALGQSGVVDGRVGRQLLRLDDERFGAGAASRSRAQPKAAPSGFVQHRQRIRVVVAFRDVAQRGKLAALQLEAVCVGGRLQRIDPFAQSPVELRARTVLVALAVESRLHDGARGIPARATGFGHLRDRAPSICDRCRRRR